MYKKHMKIMYRESAIYYEIPNWKSFEDDKQHNIPKLIFGCADSERYHKKDGSVKGEIIRNIYDESKLVLDYI